MMNGEVSGWLLFGRSVHRTVKRPLKEEDALELAATGRTGGWMMDLAGMHGVRTRRTNRSREIGNCVLPEGEKGG